MTGKFITIYGINNIGKTTHAKLLVEHLEQNGYKVHYVKYPVYDAQPSGPFLDKVLRSGEQKISEEELQLWFIINRYQYQPALKRFLEDGYIVVAEDYIGTGMAWGIAKGLSEEWLTMCNQGLLKEDFGILIEGQRVKAAMEKGHVHEQNEELINRCAEKFSYLAGKNNWHRVKLMERREDTADLICRVVDDYLK